MMTAQAERDQIETIQKTASHITRLMANRYCLGTEDRQDMEAFAVSEGIRRMPDFDPALGYRFVTFAFHVISGAAKRWRRDTKRQTHLIGQRRYESISKCATSGQNASDLLAPWEQAPQALDEFVGSEGCEKEFRHVYIADADAEQPFRSVELQGVIHTLTTVDGRLPDIIRLRFFDGLTQLEVGKRFGLSQMQISRLERLALAALRERLQVSA